MRAGKAERTAPDAREKLRINSSLVRYADLPRRASSHQPHARLPSIPYLQERSTSRGRSKLPATAPDNLPP